MIDPNLITTIRVGELPPVDLSLTSVIPHEVGTDLKKGTIQQLLDLLRPLVGKLQYEIVELDVTTQYIVDNFDNTGLGKNLCLGFAICNGQNGTKNRDGRSSIAYGTNFGFVGVLGGEANHILTISEMPSHTHASNGSTNTTGGFGQNVVNNAIDNTADVITKPEGGGLAHNTYHPYIVTLTIMKL